MAKAKIKTLLGTGLAALCSHIKQCNTAIGDLSEATANGFEETDDILHEKQDVTAAVSFTIPVDGWGEDDSSPGYFYCDIPIAGLLATDIVDVTVLPEFYDVAGAVGFIATESLEGKLRLRAAKAPTEKISAQYHITSTVKYTDAQEGGPKWHTVLLTQAPARRRTKMLSALTRSACRAALLRWMQTAT